MNETIEHFFDCPYCGEEISILIEPLVEEQSYVEDCEVCCRPVQLRLVVQDGEVDQFDAEATGG